MGAFNPVVLIPSYNTGSGLLCATVENALGAGLPVRVMIDGSTDGSDLALSELAAKNRLLEVWRQDPNAGKGAAVKAAAERAFKAGFTHALSMDADGQHPAAAIPRFLAVGKAAPDALVMGKPEFGPDAPKARLYGRKLTIFWTDLETLWDGLGDTLFGMRLYPLKLLLEAFAQTSYARGFDFDPEIAVRMRWLGCGLRQVPVECRYLGQEEGGVSHFHYLRDNVKLTWLHLRLVPEFLFLRLWQQLWMRRKGILK